MNLTEDTAETVNQAVISALLTALTEIMGDDGRKSILRYAKLNKYLDKNVIPDHNKRLPYTDFKALIEGMGDLLGHGTNAILFESGRKFAIYLAPFGYELSEVIKNYSEWIGGKWSINDSDDEHIVIKVLDCPVCKGITSKEPICTILSGALSQLREEITGKKHSVKEVNCIAKGDSCCEFIITPNPYLEE